MEESVALSPAAPKDRFAKWFPKVDQWDKALLQSTYHKFEGSPIRKIARVVSIFGDPKWWIAVLILTFVAGVVLKDLTMFVIFFTGFFQSFIIYYIIKLFFHRPRPFRQFNEVQRLDNTGKGYSFPSGHAHHSTLLVGLLWLYFFPQPWILILLILYNIAIGYSRLISGGTFYFRCDSGHR